MINYIIGIYTLILANKLINCYKRYTLKNIYIEKINEYIEQNYHISSNFVRKKLLKLLCNLSL